MSSLTPDPNAPAIEIRTLRKSFGDLEVLKGIDLTINRGEVVCVIGPSGSGKSTLLRSVNLLEEPTSGSIHIEGMDILDPDVDLDAIRARIGMVFQQFNLFPHMTVLRNLTIAQEKVLRRKPAEAQKIARDMLARVGLAEKEAAHPAQLSGGQMQRVAIARALMMNPSILLADEPTGNLDHKTAHEIMELFKEINQQGTTIVLITHEDDIAAYAKQRYELYDGLFKKGGKS